MTGWPSAGDYWNAYKVLLTTGAGLLVALIDARRGAVGCILTPRGWPFEKCPESSQTSQTQSPPLLEEHRNVEGYRSHVDVA
jgi:hypothetical protein